MTPYYDRDGITIYCADCRDVLPELEKVDLVLTDPPYGIEYQSGWRAGKHHKIQNDSEYPVDVLKNLIALGQSGCYAFCRWDNLSEIPKPKSVLAWVKNNWTSGDLEHSHGRQWEAICFWPGVNHHFVKRIPDVIHCDKQKSDIHPTEKTVALLRKIIGCNVGDIVLDPFMGSGTTLLAAKALGRKCVGIEISEKYCQIAVERLRQGELFGIRDE